METKVVDDYKKRLSVYINMMIELHPVVVASQLCHNPINIEPWDYLNEEFDDYALFIQMKYSIDLYYQKKYFDRVLK